MAKRLLFTEDDFTIWREEGIPAEAMTFLDDIAWGTEGAVYEHKNTSEQIKHLSNPTLMSVREKDVLVATAVFCNTPVAIAAKSFNCYYVRYFASAAAIRGRGIVKRFSIKLMDLIKQDEKTETIYFAYIERGNKGSYKVVESAGYKTIGAIKTVGFSRFFPKKNKNIEQVTNAEGREEVIALLKQHYKQHTFVQFNSLFINNNYFVLRENNEIVAGCQYFRGHWVVNNMAGLLGKIIMNTVPYIPLLNQLFNPKKFEFLAFEGIYFKQGYEHRLYELFEGLLAQENLKSAMFWMAENCPYHKQITRFGKLGLLNLFTKTGDVYVLASYKNMSDADIKNAETNPLYASAFDFI